MRSTQPGRRVRGPDAAVLGAEAAAAGARRHLPSARGPQKLEAQVAAVAAAHNRACLFRRHVRSPSPPERPDQCTRLAAGPFPGPGQEKAGISWGAASLSDWKTLWLSRNFTLPLDRAGRLGGDVVDHAVDAAHLVDDPGRDPAEDPCRRAAVRGHAVAEVTARSAQHVLVGARVAHDADGAHRQQHGEGLPDGVVQAGVADLLEEDARRPGAARRGARW